MADSTNPKPWQNVRIVDDDGNPLGQGSNGFETTPISDFALERALGKIPGISNSGFTGHCDRVGGTSGSPNADWVDVWEQGGLFTYPTAGEQLQIRSTSANDTAAGTGARSIQITYMDFTDRQYKSEIVALNGTTPVQLATSTFWRYLQMVALFHGSSAENEGDIILERTSDSEPRGLMPAGKGRDYAGFYTVPDGFSFGIKGWYFNTPKDSDVQLRNRTSIGPEIGGGFFNFGEFSAYQSFPTISFDLYVFLPQRAEIRLQAKSVNPDTSVEWSYFGVLIETAVYDV